MRFNQIPYVDNVVIHIVFRGPGWLEPPSEPPYLFDPLAHLGLKQDRTTDHGRIHCDRVPYSNTRIGCSVNKVFGVHFTLGVGISGMVPVLEANLVGGPIGFSPLVTFRKRCSLSARNGRHRTSVDHPLHGSTGINSVNDVLGADHTAVVNILRYISTSQRLRFPVGRISEHGSDMEDACTFLECVIVRASSKQIASVNNIDIFQSTQIIHTVLTAPRTCVTDTGSNAIAMMNQLANHVSASESRATCHGHRSVFGRY